MLPATHAARKKRGIEKVPVASLNFPITGPISRPATPRIRLDKPRAEGRSLPKASAKTKAEFTIMQELQMAMHGTTMATDTKPLANARATKPREHPRPAVVYRNFFGVSVNFLSIAESPRNPQIGLPIISVVAMTVI